MASLTLTKEIKELIENELNIPIYYLAITDLENIDDLYGEKGGVLFWEGYSSESRDNYWEVMHYELHEYTLMIYKTFGGNPRDRKIQDKVITYFDEINTKLGHLTGTTLPSFRDKTYMPLFLAGQSPLYFPELLGNKQTQNYIATSFTLQYGLIREN